VALFVGMNDAVAVVCAGTTGRNIEPMPIFFEDTDMFIDKAVLIDLAYGEDDNDYYLHLIKSVIFGFLQTVFYRSSYSKKLYK
jgi:hypothetical protein